MKPKDKMRQVGKKFEKAGESVGKDMKKLVEGGKATPEALRKKSYSRKLGTKDRLKEKFDGKMYKIGIDRVEYMDMREDREGNVVKIPKNCIPLGQRFVGTKIEVYYLEPLED